MERYTSFDYTWGDLLTLTIVLLGLFFLLRIFLRIAVNISLGGVIRAFFIRGIKLILLIYEPLALVLLLGLFVMISPWVHGIIIAIVLLGTTGQIRNFFEGSVILSDPKVIVGAPLVIGNTRGNVTKLGRLGLYLRNQKGLHFVNYATMLRKGYTHSTEHTSKGHYQLSVLDDRKDKKPPIGTALEQLISTSPYIEAADQPYIRVHKTEDNRAIVRLTVRNIEHLEDLTALLQDQGFKIDILNT